MIKFLTKNSKAFYITFGIMVALMFIAALYFITNYAHVHVYYTLEANGAISAFDRTAETTLGYSNKNLFDYFTKNAGIITYDSDGVGILVNGQAWVTQNPETSAKFMSMFPDAAQFSTVYAPIIFDFQVAMSQYNDLIVIFGVIGIVCFALLLVFANHSRRIYYKSNLIAGVVLPLVVVVFAIIMIVKNVGLMNVFNENYDLFNVTSVLQNPAYSAQAVQLDIDWIVDKFSCNSITFIVYTVIYSIIIIYSLFLVAYACIKYKFTGQEREEIIKRAVVEND